MTKHIPIQIEEKSLSKKTPQIVDQSFFNRQKPKNSRYLSQYDNTTAEEYKGKLGQSPNPVPNVSVGISNDDSPSYLHGRIDHLENVEKSADQTLLNTREVWFYTFNSRVKHQIYWHWIRELKTEIQNMKFQHGKDWYYLSQDPLTTHIEVILDTKGYLSSLIIRKKSGLKELDRASASAIQKAHPFPNPPQELISEHGMIHLNYTFALSNE